MISTSPNERALLGCLLAKLAALDADVLVGHNIGAYELAVLMDRLQTHKVGIDGEFEGLCMQSCTEHCRLGVIKEGVWYLSVASGAVPASA